MWYSVVNPCIPAIKNKVLATFKSYMKAQDFALRCEESCQPSYSPFFVISTPTKLAIGEVVDPNDLTEDERW